ncbi:MAG TPA: lipopolysaccharide heptosyltransferase I [Burkholderiales bacterium]|nr:lipopolysaccharide heptosyltransferase I [Burkholderiales bacterium]
MKRILFVKTSSLGDVVHHCPAVSDAAARFPGAAIDWVVEAPFAGVAAMHPAVRRAIPVSMRSWRNALWHPAVWSEMGAFRRALVAERYDTIIDTQSLVKSALVCRFASGTKHGMDRASAREPLAARFYDVKHPVPRALHAVERNRRLTAAALGYALDGECSYGLRINGAAPARDGYSVLLTMTSRADKLWPEPRWMELGRALGTSLVLPWGSDEERARAERIAGGIKGASVPGRMSIAQLGELFAGARRVVGLDTGLTHLAAALGAATVGIYCGSDPARTGLYGAAHARNVGAPGRAPEVTEVLESLA